MTKDTPPGGLKAVLTLARAQRRPIAIACALAAAGSLLAVLPFLVAVRVATGPSLSGAAFLAACLVLPPVAQGLSTGLAHAAAFDALYRIRRDLADRLPRLPLGYFTARQTGTLKRTLHEDVEALELFLSHQLPDMTACLMSPLLILLLMAAVDWRYAVAALGIVPVALLVQKRMMQGHGTRMGEYFSRIGAINGATVEYTRGLPTLRGVPPGSPVETALLDQISGFRAFAADWYRLWGPSWAAYTVVAGASLLLIAPLALWLTGTGSSPPTEAAFALLAATGLGPPLLRLTVYGEITLRVVQAERKITAIHTAPALPEPGTPAPLPQRKDLSFEAVSLRTKDTLIIDSATFTIPAGKLTAIIGPSGAGKSTLLRLAARFSDPDSGRIRLGGTDLRDLASTDLARCIGLVSQDTFLFDDTVEANLRLALSTGGLPPDGPEADAALRRAVSLARCEDVIAALPEGYATRLGRGGHRLSGGQRQRLALARTLLATPPVLLLDEVSASVDPVHEALLQQAIAGLPGERTIVVVSHRLDSTCHADHLVFVERGTVTAEGDHPHLLATCPAYARLWSLQQSNLGWDLRSSGKHA